MATVFLNPVLLLFVPNASELMITLLIIVVLFGGKKIPELAKGLGKGIREFNEAKDGIKNEIEAGVKEKDKIQSPGGNTPSSNA